MTFFVTLVAAKSIATRCYFPTPRRARSTFFTLFNAAEVAVDLRGSGREGTPIFYMEMCKWYACLGLVRNFLGWRGREERRPCKKGDVICFNFLLFIQKCKVQ